MPGKAKAESPSKLIDRRIRELPDWQGTMLARIRGLIKRAVPDVVEEWKWRGVPVWEHDGIICTGETYKDYVKLTFAKGASLPDPARLFNASLGGNMRRAMDIHECDELDERAFRALVRAAASLNESSRSKPTKPKPTAVKAKKAAKARKVGAESARSTATKRKALSMARKAAKPKLLSGGNPQIPKGYGDAPVQAYIDAMPDWKRDVGRSLDAIITRNVPDVRKAVKWNSPFYGVEGQGWIISFHTFTKYVKVTFFQGASLRPLPPGESKDEGVRSLDVHEDDLDEAQLAKWAQQAATKPGWVTADIRG